MRHTMFADDPMLDKSRFERDVEMILKTEQIERAKKAIERRERVYMALAMVVLGVCTLLALIGAVRCLYDLLIGN